MNIGGHDTIRVATINCENKLGNSALRDRLAAWMAHQHLDVVALTEPGSIPLHHRFVGDVDGDDWYIASSAPVVRASDGSRTTPRGASAILLVHRRLHASIIDMHVDNSGRAVAVILRGGTSACPSHTVFACAYMPTGLDFMSETSAAALEANRLHDVLQRWCRLPNVHIAALLGDFNEVRCVIDRRRIAQTAADHPNPVERSRIYEPSRIASLCGDNIDEGIGDLTNAFVDCYRSRHPSGGFTCAVPTPNHPNDRTESRIDFVFLRDTRSAHLLRSIGRANDARIVITAATVEAPSPLGSWPSLRHCPVLVALTGDFAIAITGDDNDIKHKPADAPRDAHQSIDIGRADDEERRCACIAMEKLVKVGVNNSIASRAARASGPHCTTADLDALTIDIVAAARTACRRLPRVGGKNVRHDKWRTNTTSLRRRLTRLRDSITDRLTSPLFGRADHFIGDRFQRHVGIVSSCWLRASSHTGRDIALPHLNAPPRSAVALRQWAVTARSTLRWVDRRLLSARIARDSANRAAVRLVSGYDWHAPCEQQPRTMSDLRRAVYGRRSPPVTCITDPNGAVVISPAKVAATFGSSYTVTFSVKDRRSDRSAIDDAIVTDIDEGWYHPLMRDVTYSELEAAVAGVDWSSAAGHDGIGAGVWRAFIMDKHDCPATRATILFWASACIRARHAASHSKHTLFVPLGKNGVARRGAARVIGDTRPIALQAALTKIVSKILARRLSIILARHRILRGTQNAFMRGGSAHHSVHSLFNACERAQADKACAYFLFVDFKGAFDAIRHDDIGPALRRLRVPASYIEWVNSSLTGLTGSARIGDCCSPRFNVTCGVPQGCPESPLWYIVVLDSLLARLDQCIAAVHRLRPLSTSTSNSATVAGTTNDAYADDLRIDVATRAGVAQAIEITQDWSAVHGGTVSATKTVVAGIVCSDGNCIDARDELSPDPIAIAIDDNVVRWQPADDIVHLGMTLSLRTGPRADAAFGFITRTLIYLCYNITSEQLYVASAICAVNTFVLPKIAYRLRVLQPPDKILKRWNTIVARTVCARAGVCLRYPIKAEAVATITGVNLPEHEMHADRVADAFIRLNGRDVCDDTISARREFEAVHVDPAAARVRYPFRRMAAAIDSMALLGWRYDIVGDIRPHRHNNEFVSIHTLREAKEAAVAARHLRPLDLRLGPYIGTKRCIAYTDGSATSDPNDKTCAWAVLIQDDWLLINSSPGTWLMTLSEEDFSSNWDLLQHAPVARGRIDPAFAHGSYAAELRAILEAIWRAPPDCQLTICTDSRSAIDAIKAWRDTDDVGRVRVRMPCRPFLRAISDAMDDHTAQLGGGDSKRGADAPSHRASVDFVWVAAHSGAKTKDAFANRVVDYFAKLARVTTDAQPQLHIGTAERWITLYESINSSVITTATTPHTHTIDNAASASSVGSNEAKELAVSSSPVTLDQRHANHYHYPIGMRVIAGDIRHAAVDRLHLHAAAKWRTKSSQRRFASCADGAAELWLHIAGNGAIANSIGQHDRSKLNTDTELHSDAIGYGDGDRAVNVPRRRYDSATCALTLRLLSDTLHHHTPVRTQTATVWRCTDNNCSRSVAAAKGIGDDALPVVPFTTAHLFVCRAAPVRDARAHAARLLHDLLNRYTPRENGVINAYEDDGEYLQWWRTTNIAERQSSYNVARGAITGAAAAAATAADVDNEAMAAAIGAFTTKRARAAMTNGAWRVPKDERDAAVTDLRSLCIRVTRCMWTASYGNRTVMDARTFATTVAGSHREYDPNDPDRDRTDNERYHDAPPDDHDDDGNEAQIDLIIDYREGDELYDSDAGADKCSTGIHRRESGVRVSLSMLAVAIVMLLGAVVCRVMVTVFSLFVHRRHPRDSSFNGRLLGAKRHDSDCHRSGSDAIVVDIRTCGRDGGGTATIADHHCLRARGR